MKAKAKPKTKTPTASIIGVTDAMNSAALFGPSFSGPSWNVWRAVIKATFAEPMNDAEIATFRSVAERSPPRQRVSEAVYIVGRGGGKDSIASLIATCIAVNFEPRGKLRPGEKAVVMCIAVDRTQAAIVFNYIRAYFEQLPALAALVKSIDSESIELRSGVVIEVHTNSYRSVRGRSVLCAIFDECAFYRSEDSATPDIEVHGAVAPGLARMPDSMLILISTAHKRSGLLYEKWKNYYGKDNDDVLVVRGGTLTFNPTFDAKTIARQIESDPALYNAEYNSVWRDDLSTFISRELLDAAVDHGVTVRPPIAGTNYFAFADPSGGVHDSFTVAIAHREKDGAVLDCLYERKPPFNPSEVTAEIAALLKSYPGCAQVTGDKYAAQWVIEAFSKTGIRYIQSERDRSAIYLDCLPLFTSGRVRLIENARLIAQFAALERRTFATGRDRVDHGPRGGFDDACNSSAGALVLAAAATPALWQSDQLLVSGVPAPMPTRTRSVFAVLIAGPCSVAVVYFAHSRIGGHPLVLLDADLMPASAATFDEIRTRLAELAKATGAWTATLFTTKALADIAQRLGYPAEMIDALVAEGEALAIGAAVHISGGKVKIAAEAIAKTPGILDAAGDVDDPLHVAALCGIALALDEGRSLRRAAA